MDRIEPILAEERRAKRAFAMRTKQFISSTSTLSYGGLAAALVEPLLKHQPLGLLNILISASCFCALGVCVIAAPSTEVDR